MPDIRKPLFVKPLDLGVLTADDEQAGHEALHLGIIDSVGLTWKSAGATPWVKGDLGSLQDINFIAMISANAQAGTQIRVRLGATEAEVDGVAPYDSGVLTFVDPAITREDGLYHSHLELPTVQSAQWFRIDITGHTGDFEAASIVLGQSLEPSRFYDFEYQYGVADLADRKWARFRVPEFTDGEKMRALEFRLSWQTEAEFEDGFRPFIESLGTSGMVYCCFDPEPSTWRQNRTYLGNLTNPPFARGGRKPRTFAQEFVIQSLI